MIVVSRIVIPEAVKQGSCSRRAADGALWPSGNQDTLRLYI